MLYLSSFANRIDKKGRISVPASFRAVLAKEEFPGFYASASLRLPCVECCGPKYFNHVNRMIESLPPFSSKRDAFQVMVFSDTVLLTIDGEGRVIIPDSLISHAHLRGEALFVGKGQTFELWDKEAFEDYRKVARATVQRIMENGGLSVP